MFKKISNAVNDFYFPISGFVRKLPYSLVFKTTNYCWNNCPHCCERSSTAAPKVYMPADTIKSFISQAKQDPLFSGSVVFTGGEIFTAYRFYDKHYVPDLLDYALSNGCAVDIKTNAGWALRKNDTGDRIFDDLVSVLSRFSHGTLDMSGLQISLSLDRFHPLCLEKNARFITELSRRQKNSACMVHISSFAQDADMFNALLAELQRQGNSVEEYFAMGDASKKIYYGINGTLIMYQTFGCLFNGGRAKDLDLPNRSDVSQFQFLSFDKSPRVMMGLGANGDIVLGENMDINIKTRWCDDNGNARPLSDIKQDLIRNTRRAEFNYVLSSMASDVKNLLKKTGKSR